MWLLLYGHVPVTVYYQQLILFILTRVPSFSIRTTESGYFYNNSLRTFNGEILDAYIM